MTIACIIAGQRSGTTALQSALGATGKFENFKEVFHTTSWGHEGAFLKFAHERKVQLSRLATYASTMELIDEYLDYIEESAADKVALIDVKFNSWNVMQPFWTYPHQQPAFLESLKKRGAAFLFIRRRDLAAQILSEQIARKADTWHNLTDADTPESFDVSLDLVTNQARLISLAESFLHGFIRSYPQVCEIAYEDLYSDNAVSPAVTGFLAQCFDLSFEADVVTPIRQNAGRKEVTISNYAEAAAAVAETARKYHRESF